jgi:hypothetical protein
MDDVYHWGGEFADIFVYDIYPYMSLDYRFGEVGQLRQPRQATTHYSFAQMRNLTRSYGKDLGFWFGTYNPRWFNGFLRADMAAMAWSEREMAFTAVAQGADWLITGYGIPVHAGHWRELGEGLRLLQQGGAEILETERARAPVALLFPRTHYLHTQREYWNVCGAFELVLRAFGEVEIIHEEQVEQGELSDYKMLLLFDTEILTEAAAERIAAFVRGGGALLADAIPDKDERLEPLDALEGLFGAEGGEATRIPRSGHWIEYRSVKPRWYLRPEDPPDENDFETATLMDEQLGEIRLVSPREVNVTNGEMLLSTEDGAPALMRHEPGPGRVYLLGFCLQDTYWEAWTEYDAPSREGLRALIRRITDDAGLRSHVHSSNPQIEAALRANDRVAFLFVINHETEDGETVVTLRGLPFELARAADLATGEPAAYKREGDSLVFDLNVPLGEVTLIRLGAR